MSTSPNQQFKDPRRAIPWLQAALDKECEKYERCPVLPDMVPGYETAQGWGYVVAGYFLLEESFKVILHLQKKRVPRKHSLTKLFELLDPDDKNVLREYYSDYRATIGDHRAHFPFSTLDEFLVNLDGDLNQKGTDHMGSFDWRYFPIEERRSRDMPVVSIDYLHEVIRGCINIAEYIFRGNFPPLDSTRSQRMRWSRKEKYNAWLMVRMNSADWENLCDRLEILWGPDYRGRYDLLLFQGDGIKAYFAKLPENFSLPLIDKRTEVEAFDLDKGYESIGATVIFPSTS